MALNLPKAAHLLRSTSLELPEPVHGTRNIVLALDNTDAGQKVLEWACSLYKVRASVEQSMLEICSVHVSHSPVCRVTPAGRCVPHLPHCQDPQSAGGGLPR